MFEWDFIPPTEMWAFDGVWDFRNVSKRALQYQTPPKSNVFAHCLTKWRGLITSEGGTSSPSAAF